MTIFIPLGITASIFQLVILREFSFSIAKNELGFVVAAGFWIACCSLGSMIKLPEKMRNSGLPVLAALCFSFSICLIHLVKSLIGLKYYQATSLGLSIFLSLALIGPAALIIGFAFRQLVQKYLEENPPLQNTYTKFFAFEAIGFLLGGLGFTLYLKNYTNPLIFTLLPFILLPAIKNTYKKVLSAVLILIITVISVISFNSILKKEFDHPDTLVQLGSGYGPVVAVQKAGITSLFSGGSLLATSEDKSANEEFIHMSLSAEDPALNHDILFIGAAISGQIDEIAKYKLNSLDCLQINPLISKLIQDQLPAGIKNGAPLGLKPRVPLLAEYLSDQTHPRSEDRGFWPRKYKITLITNDPRAYLENTRKKYDFILMSIPAPANLTLNRYFTEDFFKLIAGCLKPKGTFSFFIPSKREILSPQFARFNSSIINALDKVFANRLLIPADTMIIIASNEKKIEDYSLLKNFAKAKPKTAFFTIFHFKDFLSRSMRDYTQSMLDRKIAANTDLNPSGFLNYLILEQIKSYFSRYL